MNMVQVKLSVCACLLLLSAAFGHAQTPGSIVVLGDSLSAAYDMRTEEGWVAALESALEEASVPATVTNASISGATTAAGLQRLPSLIERYQPEWLLLQLGGNDGLQGKPVSYVRANLVTLIEMAQDSGAKVALLGVKLPPNLGARYTEPFFSMYAELAETYDLPYVPFLLEGVAGDAQLMLPDGIHPKADARDLIFANIWQVLESHLLES